MNNQLFFHQSEKRLDKIPLKTVQGYDFVSFSEIIRIEAVHNNCNIFLLENEKALKVLCNMIHIESFLLTPYFFRCHRSHIVNMNHVLRFIEKDRKLITINGEVPISEDRIKQLKKEYFYFEKLSD